MPCSPALLILWAPGGFRFTCYYYRGAYYKAFWADPPACAVGEPRKSYWGEKSLPLIFQNIHRYFLYLALIFLIFLAADVWHALWFTDPMTGLDHFGIGLGTHYSGGESVCLLSGYTFGCHSLRHLIGGGRDKLSRRRCDSNAYSCVSCLNRRHMLWAWCSLFMVAFRRCLCAALQHGHLARLENFLMADYPVHQYDVLIVGAGGAGLRAAIEASAAGVSVGLVCKSLLGKAHTVMAEGGIAASLGNVDERDNWQVHFTDTMRGGQYVNNWRMAELHAKEAPARVRELEAWGAVFDRTADGKILQRNFGGHRYPRLAHVGDRTGLEMIRTLQDHGMHQGMDVHMECTLVSLLKDGRAGGRRVRLRPGARAVQSFSCQGGRAGHGRNRPGVQNYQQQLGRNRRRTFAGLPRRRGTGGHGIHPVPPHRNGLAAERAGNSGHRGRSGRRRRSAEQGGPAIYVRRHSGTLPQPDGRQ